MKMKNLFVALGGLALIGGASIGLANGHKEMKVADAAVANGDVVIFEGKTNWNNLGKAYQLRFADAGSNSILVDTENLVNDGEFHFARVDNSAFGFTATRVRAEVGSNYSDYFDLSSMSNTIWVPNDPGTGGGGTYSKTVTSFNITVSFSDAAPEGQQIYIGSDLNSWGFLDLNANNDRTVYSRYVCYSGTKSSFEYKLLTSASGDAKSWDNVIISNGSGNATATISNGVATLDTDNDYFHREPIDCTLKVTFSSAVPTRVDIHIRGAFNSWSSSPAVAMMTRVSNTVFTYALEDVYAGSYEYKVVAEYQGAASVTWNYQIDTSNQTLILQESDDGEEVVLGSARSYDFDEHMPETYVADNAVVTLTFAEGYDVPTTVNIYFVGGLTDWCTTASTLESGKMTRVSSRVFTWAIPAETHTGDYEYKIVAMSAYSGETTVSYTYLVYGVLNANETLTIDTSTTNYALNALNTNLSELGAIGFAQGFNSAMATRCADENANNKTAVSAIWSTWSDNFDALTSGARTQFGSSNNADVVQARTLYLHCVARYSLAAWTDAPSAQRMNMVTVDNNSLLVIVLVSTLAVSAVAAFYFIRKRKADR